MFLSIKKAAYIPDASIGVLRRDSITEYLNSHPDVSKYRAAKALSLSTADVYEWGQKKLEEEKQKKGGSGKTPQKKDMTIENWLGEDNKS